MKLKLRGLFFVIILLIGSAGCGSTDTPNCPTWAAPTLGNTCQTVVLTITPDDNVGLYEWKIGIVELNDSHIDNVYGIQFFDPEGSEIQAKDMKEGVQYFFKKTVKSGAFNIWANDNYDPMSSGTTLVILAKP